MLSTQRSSTIVRCEKRNVCKSVSKEIVKRMFLILKEIIFLFMLQKYDFIVCRQGLYSVNLEQISEVLTFIDAKNIVYP